MLDDTPLPGALADLVHVDAQDRNVSHTNLLTAVFGKAYKPSDPTAVFPGLWLARLAIPGLGDATYDIELRKNGQLGGSGSMGRSGIFAQLAGGFEHLLDMKIPVRGRWSYEAVPRVLTLDMTAEGFGTSTHEVIRIVTTGRERKVLHGTDLIGRPWSVQRLS